MQIFAFVALLFFVRTVYAQLPTPKDSIALEAESPCIRYTVLPKDNLLLNTQRILQAYIDSGYLAARVDSIRLLDTLPTPRYLIYFYLATRYYLHIQGDSLVWTPQAIEHLARHYVKDVLKNATLETQLKAEVTRLQTSQPVMAFTSLQTSAYPLVSIENHGDLRIRQRLWYTLLKLKEGNPFASQELVYVDRVLASLSYLRSESPSTLELLDTGALRMHLFVSRKKAHFIEGLLGFSPSQKKEGLIFFGNLNVHLENLLSRGILCDFRWKGKGDEDQQATLRSQFPYLFDSPWGLDVHIEAELQERKQYRWSGQMGVTYHLTALQQLLFAVERSQVSVSRIDELKQSATLFWVLAHTYRFTSWNGLWAEGLNTETSLAIGMRERNNTTSHVEGRYLFEGKYLQTLWRNLYSGASLGVRGHIWGTSDILPLEGYRFGGAAHFRGIPETAFLTHQYAYATLMTGAYLGNWVRMGGIFQVGELEYLQAVRFALSYGAEVELRTQVGGLLIGLSRFHPVGNWRTASNAVLHLQMRFTF